MPAGGRGYTRPPSLISLWSTAPFLLNNSVGPFEQDPSVDARMRVFNASIEQMLWPEKRAYDKLLGDKVPGVIDRTTMRSEIRIPAGFLPDLLRAASGPFHDLLPQLVDENGDITIGPIPAEVPVNLLSNLQPIPEAGNLVERTAHYVRLLGLLIRLKHDLRSLPENASDEELRAKFADLREPMLELNKCPDFVVNRGHYFGTAQQNQEPPLSDDDKRALIEFLKTF
jgi:hypothetical protein